MNKETMREEFEAWYAGKGTKGLYGLHKEETVEAAWQSWQASRAALVVELPLPCLNCPPYACYEGGWNDMRDEAKEALEAAGITVKP